MRAATAVLVLLGYLVLAFAIEAAWLTLLAGGAWW